MEWYISGSTSGPTSFQGLFPSASSSSTLPPIPAHVTQAGDTQVHLAYMIHVYVIVHMASLYNMTHYVNPWNTKIWSLTLICDRVTYCLVIYTGRGRPNKEIKCTSITKVKHAAKIVLFLGKNLYEMNYACIFYKEYSILVLSAFIYLTQKN